jgi:cobalt-zinc-cadmium efflux system outer membrane protein
MSNPASTRAQLGCLVLLLALATWAIVAWSSCPAEPSDNSEALPEVWSLEAAIQWALVNNPELAVIREQHGIAAAAVVIADTYPFNPFWEGKILPAFGPESAGITNSVVQEHKLLLELEVHHQGHYRREGAAAALSRTDWEIAAQELAIMVRVIRAFDAFLYRQEKLSLIEQTVRLNTEAVKQVNKLVEQAQLRAGDLVLARTEVDDTQAQLGTGRTALTVARSDLGRLLGVATPVRSVRGALDRSVPAGDAAGLILTALERRPDHQARMLAVTEAEARVRLAQADRCGNPVLGPMYGLDATRVNTVGVQITMPFPVVNKHRGEIMQREAERSRAVQELRQTEFQIRQEVEAALARLGEAQAWAENYRTQTLPNLRKALEEMDRLFAQNQPGSDVLRLIDIRRKLLRAQDGSLDALWELAQARADLIAALGDPATVLCADIPAPEAKERPPQE